MHRPRPINKINYSNIIIRNSMEFLNSKNIVFLNSIFDDDSLIYTLSNLLYSIQEGQYHPTFLINCMDAKINETLILKESCQSLNLIVTSIGLGQVKEAALLLLSSAINGRRMVFPNTLLYLSKSQFSIYDEYENLKSYVIYSSQNSTRISRLFKNEKFGILRSDFFDHTNKNRGIFLSKKEAIDLGIIDKLIK